MITNVSIANVSIKCIYTTTKMPPVNKCISRDQTREQNAALSAASPCRPSLPLTNFTAVARHSATHASGKVFQVARRWPFPDDSVHINNGTEKKTGSWGVNQAQIFTFPSSSAHVKVRGVISYIEGGGTCSSPGSKVMKQVPQQIMTNSFKAPGEEKEDHKMALRLDWMYAGRKDSVTVYQHLFVCFINI
ncbi:hypothetical protein LXL04_016859 [Taraxacum kok-saghyz]